MKELIFGLIALCSSATLFCGNEWAYLYSEVFKSRYAVAAYYFEEAKCSQIIEIGGYKTPIDQFAKQTSCVVIDPLLEAEETENGKHILSTFQAWEGNEVQEKGYGVLIMGLHLLDMEMKDWNRLYGLINGSKITVIEFPEDFHPSALQFKKIMKRCRKKIAQKIVMDFSENSFGDLKGSWPPRTKRTLFILR